MKSADTFVDKRRKRRDKRGVALVIVLAFVVLLTGLVVAYFSRTITDRQLSNSSFNQAAADQLAHSALALIISDLRQEIVNSSSASTIGSTTIYIPNTNTNTALAPTRNGVSLAPWSTTSAVNTTLIRISSTNADTSGTSGIVDQQASFALSTGTSANGRSVSAARWNQHYLLPLKSVNSPTDTTPDPSFIPPSWVYVTGTGPAALTAPNSSVIGRYAYAIYDEGALLDANVAGFPVGTNAELTGTAMPSAYVSKGSAAFADLTFLGWGGKVPNRTGVNNLVGWRNFASTGATASPGWPSIVTFPGIAAEAAYRNLVMSNTNGFLAVSGSTTGNGSTDQAFVSRQELINFVMAMNASGATTNFNANSLQFLTHFSRSVSAPTWSPPANAADLGGSNGKLYAYKDNAESPIVSGSNNPNRDMANVRFQNSGAVAHWSDGVISGSGTMITPPTSGTYAVTSGDPLLQSRFSLAKIAWLSQADPNSGTAPSGIYPQAIQACFGLTWGVVGAANGGNACWKYVGSPAGQGASAALFSGTIETLDQVAIENREPNFFEVLKAAILNGSLGVSPGIAAYNNGTQLNDTNYHDNSGNTLGCDNLYSYSFDRNMYNLPASPSCPAPAGISDMQIMQIGANIIDQFDADSYPTAIYFKYPGITKTPNADAAVPGNQVFGPTDMVYGDENLPYWMGMVHIEATVDGKPTNGYGATQGLAQWWQPLIWNPHQTPNPANSSVPPPQNYQINGYTGAGGIKFGWGDTGWIANDPKNPASSPPGSIGSNTTDPQQLCDNSGKPLQYINFSDASPTNSSFYATPLLLQSNGITGVTGTANISQMMANTYPKMYQESKNHFVGFWAGTDPKYMGATHFVNVEAQVSGAATFCLGWTDSKSIFHPYSYVPGVFAWSYGVLDNDDNGDEPQGVCTPGSMDGDAGGMKTTYHVLDDALTMRFGTTFNWQMTQITTPPIGVANYFPSSSNHFNDTYGWGQPDACNFIYPAEPYGFFICDWEVNQAHPLSQTGASATYYSDRDGVVRPGDGVFGNVGTGDGTLLFSSAGTGGTAKGDTGNLAHGRRQVILNRPFRSVGELGYTYRDEPFKTLDFFSTASADAALLDVFSVTDQARVSNGQLNAVVAGEVNLSDAPYQVIQAILAGGSKKDYDPTYNIAGPVAAKKIAQSIVATLNPSTGNCLLTNRAGLVTQFGAVATSGTGAIADGLGALPSPGQSNPDRCN